MIRPSARLMIPLAAFLIVAGSVAGWVLLRPGPFTLPFVDDDTYTVDITDYNKPKDDDLLLVDDRIEDKKTTFDPTLIDRRPFGGWQLNTSNAVIKLDVPMAKPDQDLDQLVLHPSYTSAVDGTKATVLPSVNMIDGKAKQFDDGLYAAIERAYYQGHGDSMKSHLKMIRRIFDKVAKDHPAVDYLAGGLSLSAEPVPASPKAKSLANEFLAVEVASKPIGFYTWTKDLAECFRVLRYFAQPIADNAVAVEIARVLREDQALRIDYIKAYKFYAGMTNPLIGRTPADLIDGPPLAPNERATLFPPSTTRETELFEKLFPNGLPANASLMRELITAIRSGRVNLKPQANGGWYDYQVYALETLLLPDRGSESNKLLLTKTYKKRMLEAFQALITKRRETHSRQEKTASGAMEGPPEAPPVGPRLRVEPNPTYYLRTARSYAFLTNFLGATLGEANLKSLKGLREDGERELDLEAELHRMRDLFYGLALLSAEDVGTRLPLLDDEAVDREASEKLAGDWIANIRTDRDLAVDTRVSVPVYFDPQTRHVKIWATIGVRLTALDAEYVKPPSLRLADGSGEWTPVESYKLQDKRYLIPVDEFAEIEVKGGRVYNRAELRAICDRYQTKEKIIAALER